MSLHGLSPLALAAEEGQTKYLKSLLEAEANPDSFTAVNIFVCVLANYLCFPLVYFTSFHNLDMALSWFLFWFSSDEIDDFQDNLRPIEHAALKHNIEGVRILFPVSRRIPNYPDWNIDGIMDYFHSEEAKTMVRNIPICSSFGVTLECTSCTVQLVHN